MIITLKGSPMTTGRLYATVCRGSFPQRYLVPKGKALKEDYQWQIKQQLKGQRMFTEPLRVAIQLFLSSKRKADWDNFHKLSMDAMTGLCYEDDSQIMYATVMKGYDKLNPRIEVEILPLASSKFNQSL